MKINVRTDVVPTKGREYDPTTYPGSGVYLHNKTLYLVGKSVWALPLIHFPPESLEESGS